MRRRAPARPPEWELSPMREKIDIVDVMVDGRCVRSWYWVCESVTLIRLCVASRLLWQYTLRSQIPDLLSIMD